MMDFIEGNFQLTYKMFDITIRVTVQWISSYDAWILDTIFPFHT